VDEEPAVQLGVRKRAGVPLGLEPGAVVSLQAAQELEKPDVAVGEGTALVATCLGGYDRG
jgi:hypothetical protein